MKTKKLIIIFLSLILFSCTNKEKKTEENSSAKKSSSENEVQLSDEQLKSIGIEIGKIETRSLSGTIKANGMLDVPPQNLVSISAPLGGFVKSTELLQGMHVTKGQTIVVLEHPDYIQLQQDYLDNKSQLEFLEQEYKRQQDLSKENVNALKALQQAKSNYFGMKARVEGLKAKLKLVHIDVDDIEKNGIKNSISIPSPINGFVSEVNVNLGMHVNPTDVMFKIVDVSDVHAEVQVFEKDIPKLKINQLVHITLANENKERLAKVYLIGKEISVNRTVRVHCHFEGEDSNLIPQTYFSAIIETGSNSVYALAENAIANFEGNHFVFVEKDATKHEYELLSITTGASADGFVEVTLSPTDFEKYKDKIVVRGAYDLLNMLKNVEE